MNEWTNSFDAWELKVSFSTLKTLIIIYMTKSVILGCSTVLLKTLEFQINSQCKHVHVAVQTAKLDFIKSLKNKLKLVFPVHFYENVLARRHTRWASVFRCILTHYLAVFTKALNWKIKSDWKSTFLNVRFPSTSYQMNIFIHILNS